MSTDMRTSRAHVVGLGSAKDGVDHWWMQRLTAIALIPLTIAFVIPFANLIGAEAAAARAVYHDPINAIVAVLFIAALFYHLKLGLQTVVEDYVHAPVWRTTMLIVNALGCAGLGAAGVFAVAMVALSAQ